MARSHCLVSVFFLLVLFLAAAPCSSAKADEYWISFAGGICDEYRCPDPKYLMRIDALGNVLLPPRKVPATAYRGPLGGATALGRSNSPAKLVIWFAGRDRGATSYGHLYMGIVDKRSLATLSMRRTSLKTLLPYTLPGTQRAVANFIVLGLELGRPPELVLVGASISNPSARWFLTECVLGSCGFALSADGGMFGYTNGRRMFLQRLESTGRPIGKPQLIRQGRVGIRDVSALLGDGKRYLLYSEHSDLFLQPVDSLTGSKMGERKRLVTHLVNLVEAALDPLGRFVIYTADAPRIGRALTFQALDALGNPSGRARVIGPEAYGIDILKE